MSKRKIISVAVLGLLVVWALANASSARAGTVMVTTLNDSGPGSLRQAIADASSGDTITFGVKGTITLSSGALMIDKSLDIEGPGPNQLKISGNCASRVFVIASGTVTIAGVTISDGLADGDAPIFASTGGGILNLASLILSDVVVSANEALGDASESPFDLAGVGAGGGVANAGFLAVTASSFIGNLARGGDESSSLSTLAGASSGGGILNFGYLEVSSCTFRQNQAIGGNDSVGPMLSGHSFGGAIGSGGTSAATLVVRNSQFVHNQAIGGNGGNVTLPVPGGLGPNKASGAAIDIFGGTGTMEDSVLEHNQALGGAGGPGANGGVGAGGAIVVTNVSDAGSNLTILDSVVAHNTALGGPGATGGDGVGGGLSSVSGATLTVIGTTVAHNHAQGGEAGFGGYGGNGLGGGLYDDASATLDIIGATVRYNLALGGGPGGQGIGGGVYNNGGIYSADPTTVIEKNQATTSNDNIWP